MKRFFIVITGLCISLLSGAPPYPVAGRVVLPKVNLILWHQQGEAAMQRLGIGRIFEEWAKVNAPDSTLTLVQKFDDDLAVPFKDVAGTAQAPDLLWTDASVIHTLAGAGLLQPVDSLIDLGLFLPALVSSVRNADKTYGLPLQAGNHLMLFYNKRLLKTPPRTFAELIEVSLGLQKQFAAIDGFGAFVFNDRESLWVFPLAYGFGATSFGSDGKTPMLDTPEWVKAYQLLYDLKFKLNVSPQDCAYECADLSFRAGTAAMIINGDWALTGDSGYLHLFGDDLGIASWPSVGTDPSHDIPAPFVVGQYLALPMQLTGDKLRTASAFATFLAGDETAALSWTVPDNRLPALLSALNSETIRQSPVLSQTSKVLQTGVALPPQPEMTCVLGAVTAQMRLLMNDSIKADAAATAAQSAAAECIGTLK